MDHLPRLLPVPSSPYSISCQVLIPAPHRIFYLIPFQFPQTCLLTCCPFNAHAHKSACSFLNQTGCCTQPTSMCQAVPSSHGLTPRPRISLILRIPLPCGSPLLSPSWPPFLPLFFSSPVACCKLRTGFCSTCDGLSFLPQGLVPRGQKRFWTHRLSLALGTE